MIPLNQIQATVAQKLDASPRVVWDWRRVLRTWSVWIGTFGAVLNMLIGAAVWVSPILGVLWITPWAAASVGLAFIVSGLVVIAGVIARFLTQKDGTPAQKPDSPV